GLRRLQYAADSYDDEQTTFWLNGDLMVTPREQMNFLQRLLRGELAVAPQHADALKSAFLMPAGKITMGAGERNFVLHWPNLGEVHAKTGNTTVDGEAVSWVVGYFDAGGSSYVFAARSRAEGSLPLTAASELA